MEPLFAYAKIPVANLAEAWHLCDFGFRIVDVALTFDAPSWASANEGVSRFASSKDREAVAEIASTSFLYSRFHLDPCVPKKTANAIKCEWATNFFDGKRGDGMVVAEQGGRVVGFLQLLWVTTDCLAIDLIAVGQASQGMGMARDMINYAARYGTGDGRIPTLLRVGTQAANTPSVRLYETLGFRLVSAQYILHYHSDLKTEKK